MRTLLLKLGRLHWPLLFLTLALCVASVFFVYSATYFSEGNEFHNAWLSQIFWLGVGLGVFFVIALVDYHFWIEQGPLFFAGVFALLLAVLAIGIRVYGAKRWISLGPIGLQPSELEKLSFILMLAWLLCRVRERGFKLCLLVGGLIMLPAGLILLQPDLGSASVLFPVALAMLYVAGLKKRYLLLPLLAVVAVVLYTYIGVHKLGWTIPGLKPYQMARIRTFYDPSLDPLNRGWTINQSLIAIGSGGFEGKGYLKGTQNMLGFLPRNISYTDFIFAVVGEDWGFRGAGLVIAALSALILLSVHVAHEAEDNAGALLATGVAAMLFTHFFVNVGMTIKVVPITGIPLPFISYGGTFMVICLASVGMVQSVWIHRRMRSD
ncbi:MAG: rod shape-determining protein RodA [Verrucomicrobium sp.]|nr:rod shape-determining protein RodA [Verrucomicrobium sp.]